MAGVNRGLVGHGIDALVNAAIELLGASPLKIRASATPDKEGISRKNPILAKIGHAGIGVSGNLNGPKFVASKIQDIPIF